MVRSICKAALGTTLVAALAWVGFAWSQSPPTPATLPKTADAKSPADQPTMTVHENGKAIQCKLLVAWQCANGARAFQLEVLDTGEKLTMVEDGPGTSFQSKAGRMRSLPMRIFHWGRSRTSPPGAPLPPPQMISSQDVGQPTILNESDPVLVRISPEPVAPPGCEICSCENTPNASPYNKVKGGMTCTSSKPCAPPTANELAVTEKPAPNTASASKSPPDSPLPGAPPVGPPPLAGTPPENVPSASLPPTGLPGLKETNPSPATPGSPLTTSEPTIVSPPSTTPMVVGPPPAPLPQMVNVEPKTSAAPPSLPMMSMQPQMTSPFGSPGTMPSAGGPQLIPINPTNPAGMAGAAPSSIPAPGLSGSSLPSTSSLPAAGIANAQPAPMNPSNPTMQMMPPAHTSATPGASAKAAQNAQSRGLVNRLRGALIANDKKSQTGSAPRTPEPLANRVSPDPQKADGRPQLAEMARGQQSSPSSLPGASPSALPGTSPTSPTAGGLMSTPATSLGSPSAPGAPVQMSSPGSFPLPYPGSDLSKPQGSSAPSTNGQNLTGLLGPGNNAPPSAQVQGNGAGDPAKRDWRSTWGKPPAGQTPPPGQSVVEPPPAGKGPLFTGMKKDNAGPPAGLFSTMPPASVVQNSKQPDPLLSPERYSTPKVENKAMGDRRIMDAARYRDTPPATTESPAPAQAPPVGIQSVVSANNGVDMPLRFVPVPVVTIPQPMRPPGPPKPEVPQPPQPAAWTNAFAPVKQPNAAPKPTSPSGQPSGPTMSAPMAGMQPQMLPGSYGPQFDPRMMQMPSMQQMPNMHMAQPNPYVNPYGNPAMMAGMGPRPAMSGGPVGSGVWPWDNDAAPPFSAYKSPRPVANIAYPQKYAGPMAPNPAAGLNAQMPGMNPYAMQQPMQQPYAQTAGYSPMPVPAPMVPQMMMMPPRPELGAVAVPPGMPIDAASVQQWLGVLCESPYPAQREWAAMNLAAVDLQSSPDVLQALLTAAKKDPAATVRAGCVQCLARQNLTSQPVLTTLHSLTSDADPRVRTEAEQSLIRLTGSHSTPTPRPIQPVNAQQ